jgi:hypothetical protein
LHPSQLEEHAAYLKAAKSSAAAFEATPSAYAQPSWAGEQAEEGMVFEDYEEVDASIDSIQERFDAFADEQGLKLRWLEEERLARQEFQEQHSEEKTQEAYQQGKRRQRRHMRSLARRGLLRDGKGKRIEPKDR